MCTACDTAQIKSEVKLLTGTMTHDFGNIIRFGSDSLIDFINASRKKGTETSPFKYPPSKEITQ